MSRAAPQVLEVWGDFACYSRPDTYRYDSPSCLRRRPSRRGVD